MTLEFKKLIVLEVVKTALQLLVTYILLRLVEHYYKPLDYVLIGTGFLMFALYQGIDFTSKNIKDRIK